MAPRGDDGYKAGRLIQWGLRVRARPAQEPEYRELVDRYFDHTEFRSLVREVARGLGLEVLDAGEYGLVLAPRADSAFALRSADFRASSSADDRLLDGLVQVAIAATLFPRARNLEEESTIARPPLTVDEVEENLRTICERLERDARDRPDPGAGDEERGLYEAWRVYQSRLAAHETRDDRKARRATRRVIESNLERLREHGCFTSQERSGTVIYQPTWRYQVLVKDLAATTVFDRVQETLAATDGGGGSGVAAAGGEHAGEAGRPAAASRAGGDGAAAEAGRAAGDATDAGAEPRSRDPDEEER